MAGFGDFAVRLDRLVAVTGTEGRVQILRKLGKDGVRDYRLAIEQGIGSDASMSNWRRAKPVKITAGYKVVSDTLVVVVPRPIGLFYVADLGRRPKKDVVKKRGRTFHVSKSRGHNIAPRAERNISERSPARAYRYHSQLLRKALR